MGNSEHIAPERGRGRIASGGHSTGEAWLGSSCSRGSPRQLWAWLLMCAVLLEPQMAKAASETPLADATINGRNIFFMLFLMLGPIKILMPFVQMTKGTATGFRRRLATRSILFSAAALALAGVLGRTMMENFNISVPVLALTGGIILFLVALQTVLQQFATANGNLGQSDAPAGLHLAFSPLAFPTIVTPHGIAALIVFATLASGDPRAQSTVAAIVLTILAMDWAAMLFAETVLKWIGTALQVLAIVLGVTQIALGMQIIVHSLGAIGVLAERPG
jgi:multiple antibiotic resistance protein